MPRILAIANLLLALAAFSSAEGEGRGKFSVLPLPIAFSMPETGFGGGALLMAAGDFYPGAPDQKQDSYQLVGVYTVKGCGSLSLAADHYGRGNASMLKAKAYVAKMPSTFYGLGGPRDGLEEDYDSVEWSLDATAGFAVAKGLYAGPRLGWARYSMEDLEPGGILERGDIEGSTGATASFLGPRLTYEGRDSSIAPASGYFADLSCAYSPEALGAKSSYWTGSIDLRAYAQPFASYPAVIAGMLYATGALGDPPFQALPKLGGDERLRGYLDSEYRDGALAFAQAELRLPLPWRCGVVLMGGVGFMGSGFASLDIGEPRFAEGLGFRFLVDKESGAKLRIDLAWGDGKPQLYFQLGEAF